MALKLMKGMERIDPMSFFIAFHTSFEEVKSSIGKNGRNKNLYFYHSHNPDDFAIGLTLDCLKRPRNLFGNANYDFALILRKTAIKIHS